MKLRTSSRDRWEEDSAMLTGITPIMELKEELPNLDIKTLFWCGPQTTVPPGHHLIHMTLHFFFSAQALDQECLKRHIVRRAICISVNQM